MPAAKVSRPWPVSFQQSMPFSTPSTGMLPVQVKVLSRVTTPSSRAMAPTHILYTEPG